VPGARRAASTSSFTELTLSLLVLTKSTIAKRPVKVMGAKSLCGSYGSFW